MITVLLCILVHVALSATAVATPLPMKGAAVRVQADVAIYGSTVCGVTAAISATISRPELRVVLIVNSTSVGGMTSGGLGGRDCRMPLQGLAEEIWAPLGADFVPHAAEQQLVSMLASIQLGATQALVHVSGEPESHQPPVRWRDGSHSPD
jgi:ribulose 1,5-bisphosphate synthetase/thiazole synthase